YKRLALASRHQDYRLLTPMLGEPVILSEPDQPFTAWWQQVTQ
ncbi:MAG: RomA family MBL fold metallo-hydrolase, partial [Gammaproteobacteria bacterium]|nr:RomA family MBL fold metallo-hydrolase [Gammaproteobacteria bacterium]